MPWDKSRSAPIKTRTITIDGDRVTYRVGGKGLVLLLVHGIAGSAATWRHAHAKE